MLRVANPYLKRAQQNAVSKKTMGPQSQRRINLVQRTAQLKANNIGYTKRKGLQLTLTGDAAFDPNVNCPVCKAKRIGYPAPHRPHHQLCPNNRRTKGITSATTIESNKFSKKLEAHFSAPPQPHEKYSSRNNTAAAADAFFATRKRAPGAATEQTTKKKMKTSSTTTTTLTPEDLFKSFTQKMEDPTFVESNKSKGAPLAVLAVATAVGESVLHPNAPVKFGDVFDGLAMKVPDCFMANTNPEYHSVVGQTLLVVDWKRAFGLEVPCPTCNNPLQNDRTNWSKNKTLFPIFGLEGAPQWAIVMTMKCPCCKQRFNANDGAILCRLPAYAATAYPVEPKFAQSRNCHVSRTATDSFDLLMTTYANGDLCSRLLYNAVNQAYLSKISAYYSYHKCQREAEADNVLPYPAKDGWYVKYYPPLGSLTRDMFDSASRQQNPWGICDYMRWTREIQSVKCEGGMFAQDHTFDVLKNYYNKKGAMALWDVATDTGEIASAVLVYSVKTKDYAHAAEQLSRRQHFNPAAM